MLGNMKLILMLLMFLLNIGTISSICIEGDNCPYGQGICKLEKCECLAGYQTLITQDTTKTIYCNYKQTSKWIPFLLELFLPSVGLFYLGRYFHAFLKLILFMPLVWSGEKVPIICFFVFFFLYIVDLVCLFFKLYSDGYGIALI